MNIILLGPPGSGKGTQAKKLFASGFTIISTGDLLRGEMESQTELGKSIKDNMDSGKYVADEIVDSIVKKRLTNKPTIFDGYPRTIAQCEYLDTLTKIDKVFYLDIDFDVVLQRIIKRGETSGRSDDNIESATERFKVYTRETSPIVDYYNSIVQKIDAGKSEQEVYMEILSYLK